MKRTHRQFVSSVAPFLASEGVLHGIEPGGRHFKLVLALGTTRTKKLPIPGSPSDCRAIKNFMRDVKHAVASLKTIGGKS